MSEEDCKCFECGKEVDWIAEVSIYPQKTASDIDDFYTRVCLECLAKLPKKKEVESRMENPGKEVTNHERRGF